MLVSNNQRTIIGNQGWVDRGDLWVCDALTLETSAIHISASEYLEIYPGSDDYFAVRYLSPDGRCIVSVRHFEALETSVAEAVVFDGQLLIKGDRDAWSHVPRVYKCEDSKRGSTAPYALLVIGPDGTSGDVRPLAWFNAESYDLLYQSVLKPVAISDDLVAIPVQRSSRLVIYNLTLEQVVDEVGLANQQGNPTICIRRDANEMWVDDYDMLLRIDLGSLKIGSAMTIQPPIDGRRGFIGEWVFTRDEKLCIVGRPFSGDVVGLDVEQNVITKTSLLGRQPLNLAILDRGHVVARDWRTGDTLEGKLVAVA